MFEKGCLIIKVIFERHNLLAYCPQGFVENKNIISIYTINLF